MSEATTRGVRVAVRPDYLPHQSDPRHGLWMFAYHVRITNLGGETVQLLMSSRDHGWLRLPAGDSEVTLALPHVGLRPGSYRLKLSVSSGAMHDILDVVDDVRVVVADDGAGANAAYYQPRAWRSAAATVVDAPPAAGDDPVQADEG